MSFSCCHILVTGSTPSNVRPVMRLFSSKLPDPLRPRKWQVQEYQGVNLYAHMAYCIMTEALLVLSIWSISWSKSNRSRRDEYWSVTVSVKQSKMFHFWVLKSIICWKSVTCQTEIQSLSFFSIFAFILQITPARKWKVHEDNESIITQR